MLVKHSNYIEIFFETQTQNKNEKQTGFAEKEIFFFTKRKPAHRNFFSHESE